jgi:hypothetical protein
MANSTHNSDAGTPRFVRAANLELDVLNPRALDGYLLTSGARRVLGRMLPSLTDPAAPRAWTLTGPYGTGKSSFAVFAAQLFSPKSPANGLARTIVKHGDEDLFATLPAFGKRFRGLIPVAVTGSREPLQLSILRGLKATLSTLDGAGPASTARRVNKMLAPAADSATDRDLLDLVEETAKAASLGGGSGLLVVIDEMGKLLEYAASHPDKSDVYVLQHLVELADRSPVPILIVTVLHKDFAGYADRLSAHERAEWEKVRGRYEDIVFEESADEVLRLVALARGGRAGGSRGRSFESLPTKDVRKFEELCGHAWRLHLAPSGVNKIEFINLLKQCWPLHPLVSVLIGPAFRKLSQNERSVFSFLSSHEPYGLLDFLTSDRDPAALFGLDRLYDYLWNSLGEGLYAQRNGKRWAEVESALERLKSDEPVPVIVLKMIGVIGAIGGTKNIQPTPEVISFGTNGVADGAKVPTAIDTLTKASVITSRKYNNTLSLWEGSDVDIDERIKAARSRGDVTATLGALATRYIAVRPIVARRHSFETGTLRYFTIEFVEPNALAAEAAKEVEADGRILVVLPANAEERTIATKLVKTDEFLYRSKVLVAMPGESRSIDLCVRELACLEWVRDNTPQLAGDLTARRELRARVADLHRQLDVLSENMLVQSSPDEPACSWFHGGQKVPINSRRALNDFVSETCSRSFSKTPYVLNELVNRRELSSAAAAARRNLIEFMIERSLQPDLGIEGYPPERSMYLSVLASHGLHRQGDSGWEFGPPAADGPHGMHETWMAIQSFFDSTEKNVRTVDALFGELRAEPYGIRDGLLPILLCAALIASDSDVALYEEGTFVPSLAVTTFERLMKSPARFTVRRWRISGIRATVFRQMADMLGKSWGSDLFTKRNVLDVVRPLLKFVQQLPEYTRSTDELSDQAKNVRGVLLQTREADQLLFVELPRACGMDSIDSDGHLSDTSLRAFMTELKRSLGELQRHYETAVGDLGQALGTAFGAEGVNSLVRERLTSRANDLRAWVADPGLKNFITRVTDTSADERSWVESIAALLSERPPNLWRDGERAKFQVALSRTARIFRNLESLAVRPDRQGGQTESIRIGITTRDGGDVEEVIHVGPEDKATLADVTGRLRKALEDAGVGGRREIVLAALAEVAKRIFPSSPRT